MLRFVTITLRSWGYYITNYYFRIKVPWEIHELIM